MPYKDPEKQRAAMRKIVKRYRKRKKLVVQQKIRKAKNDAWRTSLDAIAEEYYPKYLALIREHPHYQSLTAEQQAAVDEQSFKGYWNICAEYKRKMEEMMAEVRPFTKIQMWQMIEKLKKERQQKIEAQLRQVLAPILALPFENRVKVLNQLLEKLHELYGLQDRVTVTVLAEGKTA